jgi:hypothetical protein
MVTTTTPEVAMTNTRPTAHGRTHGALHLDRSQESTRKRRLTITLPQDLLDRMRNAVYWTPRLTVAKMVEDAVAVKLLEMEHANGRAYPKRPRELKPGRPRQRPGRLSESPPQPVMLAAAVPDPFLSSFTMQQDTQERPAVCLVE